jgi:hypothetical protein
MIPLKTSSSQTLYTLVKFVLYHNHKSYSLDLSSQPLSTHKEKKNYHSHEISSLLSTLRALSSCTLIRTTLVDSTFDSRHDNRYRFRHDRSTELNTSVVITPYALSEHVLTRCDDDFLLLVFLMYIHNCNGSGSNSLRFMPNAATRINVKPLYDNTF